MHRLAEKELILATNWFRKKSVALAKRFVLSVIDTLRLIEESPISGTRFKDATYWRKVKKFPYLIYYQNDRNGTPQIMAVAHSKQRLGYWKNRKFGDE